MMSAHIEEALAVAGRDDVFRRYTPVPSVAIRWKAPQRPPLDDPWILAERASIDEAGEAAAREFVRRTRAHAAVLEAQAERIDDLLARSASPGTAERPCLLHGASRRGPWITTQSGACWHFEDPRPEDVGLSDLSALAHVNRFGGHTIEPYSVAEHSVRVATLVRAWGYPPETILAAVLHDGHEIYPPGDVLSPVLRACGPLALAAKEMAGRAEKVFRVRAGIPEILPECVKRADRILLATELRDLRSSCMQENMPEGVEPLPERIRPWSGTTAREEFWREIYHVAPCGDLLRASGRALGMIP